MRLFRRTVTALSAKYSTGPYRTGIRSTRFPETSKANGGHYRHASNFHPLLKPWMAEIIL
jgi:hypothetical protein